jgi:2-dehydro-3-deoxyphosphogluconate aldolase/(4S)-4-hydroxy-2-oxoglutarate aldolase
MTTLPLKTSVIDRVYREVVFSILRTDSADSAVRAAEAIIEAGITVQEVSLTTPGAFEAIARLSASLGDAAVIGAGTVMDAASARMAIDAGSRFLVCPALSEEVIKTGNRYGVPVMPGIGTVTELVQAMEWGADVVKLFPGSVLGPKFISSLAGPVPQARVIPVGGVEKDNLTSWLKAGAFALGLGKGLTHPDGTCENAALIKQTAKEILAVVAEERAKRKGK